MASARFFSMKTTALIFSVVSLVTVPIHSSSAFTRKAISARAVEPRQVIASTAQAPRAQGLALSNGAKVFTEIQLGQANAPVFILLNGLIYDVERWDALAARLNERGYTVIRMAFSPQPESLRLLQPQEKAKFEDGMTVTDLANEVRAVVDAYHLTTKFNLVGLSYGASVAAEFARLYPEFIDNTVLMAPLVVPLDNYDPRGSVLLTWLNQIKYWEDSQCAWVWWAPYLCQKSEFWYDMFYNYIYQNYLDKKIDGVPAQVDAAKFKKGVFHLIRAARSFDLKQYAALLPNLHMMTASEDSAPLLRDQKAFWVMAKTKRSFAMVMGAEHAIPDESPNTAADWLDRIAHHLPELQIGKEYQLQKQ